MPWTFAHAAAVLPLRRFCPSRLNFVALVVGSLMPDVGYYLGLFDLAQLAHTFSGALLVCLPSGLGLLGVLCLLRKPFWFLLPQPHRDALESLAATGLSLRPAVLISAAVSLVLGAWTHNAWDSFTHKNGWVVTRVSVLQEPLLSWAGIEFPVYHLLQHLSTLIGIAALAVAYRAWLRGRPEAVSAPYSRQGGDRWRYALLAAMAVVALVIAVSLAIQGAARYPGYFAWRFFAFRAAVYGTAAFILLLILCSVFCYVAHRESKKRAK